jgi:hypothetical protein
MSDMHDMLMADCWHLNCGVTMAPTGCLRLGSGVRAITLSAWLRFIGSGTLEVSLLLPQHAWSRCRTSCLMSN